MKEQLDWPVASENRTAIIKSFRLPRKEGHDRPIAMVSNFVALLNGTGSKSVFRATNRQTQFPQLLETPQSLETQLRPRYHKDTRSIVINRPHMRRRATATYRHSQVVGKLFIFVSIGQLPYVSKKRFENFHAFTNANNYK